MCGRFAFFSPQDAIQLAFGTIKNLEYSPRYNIAPTQNVVGLTQAATGKLIAHAYHWGLIPFWAKDPSIGNRMINARAETLAEKPSFRTPYRRRRCIIPASGFYEWQKQAEGKQPVYISDSTDSPIAFAGLWDEWEQPDGAKLLSCTIVTTAANDFMREFHERMPVCLTREHHQPWLAADTPREQLDELTRGPQELTLRAWPVSRRVNNPRNESAELVKPVGLGES